MNYQLGISRLLMTEALRLGVRSRLYGRVEFRDGSLGPVVEFEGSSPVSAPLTPGGCRCTRGSVRPGRERSVGGVHPEAPALATICRSASHAERSRSTKRSPSRSRSRARSLLTTMVGLRLPFED